MMTPSVVIALYVLVSPVAQTEPDLLFEFDSRAPLVERFADEVLFALGLRSSMESLGDENDLPYVRVTAAAGEDARAQRAPAGSVPATGYVKPGWLGLDREKGMLGRALKGLRAVSWRATLLPNEQDDLLFEESIEANDARDGRVVADALREFLAPFQETSNDAVAVREAMRKASVARDGARIRLTLPLSEAALSKLHHHDGSRRLLRFDFESLGREERQNLEEIYRALALSPGSVAADVGAGGGFFSVRLAEIVGESGRVYAVDIVPDVVTRLRQRAADAPYPQIEAVLGAPDDPRLPRNALDAVLIVNSYHEMPEHQAMLEQIELALKPGGRLVLVEPISKELRTAPREEQEKKHVISTEIVEEDLRQVGFEIAYRKDDITEREWLVVALKTGKT